MEAFGQAYGYILYRTQLDGPVDGELTFDTVHDYAQIYVDGKLVARSTAGWGSISYRCIFPPPTRNWMCWWRIRVG